MQILHHEAKMLARKGIFARPSICMAAKRREGRQPPRLRSRIACKYYNTEERNWKAFRPGKRIYRCVYFSQPMANYEKTSKGMIFMLDIIALILLIIGGINWGSIGILQFDLVAWLFGGQDALLSRVVYTLVGLSALWCISFFFKENDMLGKGRDDM